jgi:hypothetical protein
MARKSYTNSETRRKNLSSPLSIPVKQEVSPPALFEKGMEKRLNGGITVKGCANRSEKTEEGNLLLFTIMELVEGENASLGAGFP